MLHCHHRPVHCSDLSWTPQLMAVHNIQLLPSLTIWLLHIYEEEMLFFFSLVYLFWTLLLLGKKKRKKNIMEEGLVVCCQEASRCGDSPNEAVSCSFSSPEACLSLALSLVSRVLNLSSNLSEDSVDKCRLFKRLSFFAYCSVT